MRWFLRQLAFNAFKMLAVFAGIYFLAIWGWNGWKTGHNARADDPAYAKAVFEPLVSFRSVLASRAYHPIGPDWPNWDCTYAIVELGEDAPKLPPTTSHFLANGGRVSWHFHFGGAWEKTPMPELPGNTKSALQYCAKYFDDETTERLRRALAEPGSWHVSRGAVEKTLYIYSLPQNIAARIRFGD